MLVKLIRSRGVLGITKFILVTPIRVNSIVRGGAKNLYEGDTNYKFKNLSS